MKITERLVGGTVAVVLMGGLAVGGMYLAGAATSSPAAPVETAATFDLSDYPETNGLAVEQEAAAAQAEADRIAAEAAAAEAARVAAEQAAAAEAQRIAAEQAAETPEAVTADEPAPEVDPWAGKTRVPWIPSTDPQNAAGGDWDMSVCNGGSASTGPDGVPYCD